MGGRKKDGLKDDGERLAVKIISDKIMSREVAGRLFQRRKWAMVTGPDNLKRLEEVNNHPRTLEDFDGARQYYETIDPEVKFIIAGTMNIYTDYLGSITPPFIDAGREHDRVLTKPQAEEKAEQYRLNAGDVTISSIDETSQADLEAEIQAERNKAVQLERSRNQSTSRLFACKI